MWFLSCLFLIPIISFAFKSEDFLRDMSGAKTWMQKDTALSFAKYHQLNRNKKPVLSKIYVLDEQNEAIELAMEKKEDIQLMAEYNELPINLESGYARKIVIQQEREALKKNEIQRVPKKVIAPVSEFVVPVKELKVESTFRFVDSIYNAIFEVNIPEASKEKFEQETYKNSKHLDGNSMAMFLPYLKSLKTKKNTYKLQKKLNANLKNSLANPVVLFFDRNDSKELNIISLSTFKSIGLAHKVQINTYGDTK